MLKPEMEGNLRPSGVCRYCTQKVYPLGYLNDISSAIVTQEEVVLLLKNNLY